jgi:hemerythrin-like domain-containing protein
MMPIGPLMREHRLIERMVKLMERELRRMSETNRADPAFVDVAVDFIRTYADRCHHGKEEDILFRDLAKKQLSAEHERVMNELLEEHVLARKTTGRLVSAKESYLQGDAHAFSGIVDSMQDLVEFYPAHIEKEDRHFFVPCMGYFSDQEQGDMLQEFWDFDRQLIHDKYKMTVESLE